MGSPTSAATAAPAAASPVPRRGGFLLAVHAALLLLLLLLPLSLSHAFVQQPPVTTPTSSILPRLFPGVSPSHACPPTPPGAGPPSSAAARRLSMQAWSGSNGQGKKGGGGLGALFTAVPRFVGGKLLDAQDAVYVKRALFLSPGNGTLPASETEAVVVIFPGIGVGPKAYAGMARAVQEALATSYDIKAYVVVAKFFNNLGYLPKEPERRLASVLAKLAEQGVSPTAPLGVVGHSGGAFLAYDAALTRSQAFVHLGSTLNSRGACMYCKKQGSCVGVRWYASKAFWRKDPLLISPNPLTHGRRPPLDAAQRNGVPQAHFAATGGAGRLHSLHGRGPRVCGGGEADEQERLRGNA